MRVRGVGVHVLVRVWVRIWIHVLVRLGPCVYRHMSLWVRACVCGCVCVVHV